MSFLAPYTNAMRIGQGFNSYTQEICIENAVLIEPARKAHPIGSSRSPDSNGRRGSSLRPHSAVSDNAMTLRAKSSNESLASDATASDAEGQLQLTRGSAKSLPNITIGSNPIDIPATSVQPSEITPPHKNVVQIVTYSSRMVDNVSDIVEALNISSSASIKYGTIKGAGSASIVNENKVEQSDLNYIVTVKVTNETSPVADKMTFNPIPELDNKKFTDVFGDCFISGFTEGGEFSAIVSIKVSDKSKISAVKAAAEAEIAIAAAPGLSVGASSALDKHKSDVWDDTETTISVNWAGGGNIKPADEKWDLKTVVDVATRFPHLVQTCAQRTSAILTRYTSLRSFNETNERNPANDRFRILDYDLCSLYTQDLFSAFLAYKKISADISDILKSPEQYREKEPGKDVPDPVELNPKALNEARQLARRGMIQISDVTKQLITEPSIADLDENGQQRPVQYMWPGELRKRLPIRHHGLTIREQSDLVRRDTNFGLLSAAEVNKIGHWARDDDLEFSPLVGDHIPSPLRYSFFGKKDKDTLFCTLDSSAQNSSHLDNITKLRLFAHENRTINWLGLFGRSNRSKRCHNHLSAIGFSTSRDTSTSILLSSGIHTTVGNPNPNHMFWSQPLADFRYAKAAKVRIEYLPGEGCGLAALVVLDRDGQELTGWKSYGLGKEEGL
ncbi:hypothetical protein P7C71_g6298, partial [Lecanoromycetidae sp. Uapishka_2]